MNEPDAQLLRDFLLAGGETQQAMTKAFLRAAQQIVPQWSMNGGPYRSTRGLGSWALSYYGVGNGVRGNYRTTYMLEVDGTYSHLLINQDGEMEIQKPSLGPGGDLNITYASPSLFAESVVHHESGDSFTLGGPAQGGGEPLIEVLLRSLSALARQEFPPVFTRSSQLLGGFATL